MRCICVRVFSSLLCRSFICRGMFSSCCCWLVILPARGYVGSWWILYSEIVNLLFLNYQYCLDNQKRMRIAFIINHLGLTGVNNVVCDLVSVLVGHGHACTVFWLKDSEHPIALGCEVQKLVSKKQLADYDLIHIHGLGPMLWLARHGKVVNGVGKRIPIITTLHCYCFQDFTDLYGRVKGVLLSILYIALARRFDKVVCLSKSMMSYYGRWIPRRRLSYVYNTRMLPSVLPPVEEDVRERVFAFKGNSTLIGMNGALIYRKGVDLMLRAIAELNHEGHNFRLALAGEGKERQTFERMAEEQGLADRVLFLGMVKDAWRLLPLYNIFALPSRSEGFPLALLEAGALGVESVVSDLPIVKECFVNHRDVEMFRLSDGAEGLKCALLRAAGSPQAKEGIAKTFQEKYSPEVFYHRYIEVYSSVLEQRKV